MAASYNELFGLGSHSPDANLEGWWPLQDNAASTTVVDQSSGGNDGTLVGGSNTSDLSTTGPNSWAAKALHLDGISDYINTATLMNGASAFTVLARFNPDALDTQFRGMMFSAGTGSNRHGIVLDGAATGTYVDVRAKNTGADGPAASVSAGSWHTSSARYNGSNVQARTNKSNGTAQSVSGTITVNDVWRIGFDDFSSARRFDGLICDVVLFSRSLSDSEDDEWADGPEPINSVAPVTSGTASVGQTLSATTGTWGLDVPFSSGSNGTVTYSYQWTRSDDGTGTGEADIAGATSSTYTIQAADSGKYLRCRVRASNDGGFDPAADTATAFTGAISGGAAIGAAAYYYRHLTSQVLR